MAQTTPDLSEFIALASRNQRKPCQIAAALEALKPEERDQLKAAVAQAATIGAGAIEKWLARRQLKASIPGITSHRSGRCTCADAGS